MIINYVSSIADKTQVTLPMVRYVGPALTSGAIYVASITAERSQVICVKGNMINSATTSDKSSTDDNKENVPTRSNSQRYR